MSDLFKALVVHSVPVTHDDLTVPAIAVLVVAAFVIVTAVAAIVHSERSRPIMPPYSLLDYEDLVLDSLVFDHKIRAETVTEAEWLRIYAHFKAGDLTPTQSAAMIANARKRPSNDNTKG